MFNLGENIEKKNTILLLHTELKKNVALHSFTSFKIGGNADIYSAPSTVEELQAVLTGIHEEHIPAILLAGGTNLLLPDDGIRGAVIHTYRLNTIDLLEENGEPFVQAGAGCLMRDVMEFCAQHGLTGLENFAGLPGTVGGAAFMNARCYGTSLSDVFCSASAVCFSENGYTEKKYCFCKEQWSYKHSPFQPQHKNYARIDNNRIIITSVTLKTAWGDKTHIRSVMDNRIADRAEKGHFRLPSAGSVFKNNRIFGKSAGELVDEAGLRGLTRGGAQVAPWHGNFIVNTGSATAQDVLALIAEVQKRVKEKTGFYLEPEIIYGSL